MVDLRFTHQGDIWGLELLLDIVPLKKLWCITSRVHRVTVNEGGTEGWLVKCLDNIGCLRMGGGYWPLGLPAALCATPDTSAAGWVWWPPGCLGLHTTGHKDVFCVKSMMRIWRIFLQSLFQVFMSCCIFQAEAGADKSLHQLVAKKAGKLFLRINIELYSKLISTGWVGWMVMTCVWNSDDTFCSCDNHKPF